MSDTGVRTADALQTFNIYGPPQTKELVDAAFAYISIPFGVFAAVARNADMLARNPFAAHEIRSDGLVYQDDKIRVIAAENSHYALMPAKFRERMKSYSYRFETPHGVVVFTGGSGELECCCSFIRMRTFHGYIRAGKGELYGNPTSSGGRKERPDNGK